MVRTKKNILSKWFCFVTHGVYYFTTFVQPRCEEGVKKAELASPSAVAKAGLGTTSDLNYVDTIQSMNGIVC